MVYGGFIHQIDYFIHLIFYQVDIILFIQVIIVVSFHYYCFFIFGVRSLILMQSCICLCTALKRFEYMDETSASSSTLSCSSPPHFMIIIFSKTEIHDGQYSLHDN